MFMEADRPSIIMPKHRRGVGLAPINRTSHSSIPFHDSITLKEKKEQIKQKM
jgi:hypothetical protein